MFDNIPNISSQQSEPQDSLAQNIPTPDRDLQCFSQLRGYLRSGKIPWRKISPWKREDLCNGEQLTQQDVGARNGIAFPLRDHRFVSAETFQTCLRQRFLPEIKDASIEYLKTTMPENSAASLLSYMQRILALGMFALLVAALIKYPLTTIIMLNAIVTAYFLLAIGYRVVLLLVGAKERIPNGGDAPLSPEDLPIITILLPLYHDAASLPSLSQAIDRLDYPTQKKDIKLLLEENDHETILEAKRLRLDKRYDLIIIPEGGPRTKPKACNYGMQLARGELIVIYDAEDQPEQDQLLKAADAFHNGEPKLVCMQARLNYYNHSENWLTRMFTLEYSLWFDWLLPALQKLNAPIPLGGTSNFFKTDILIELGGWDPYNVTEDADLGLRISKSGYRVEMLDSTTFEEANCRTGNWIRQRSRWMKGHMQTWLVHMRRPDKIVATTGWAGLLSVQLFIAGNVLSSLINPILWGIFIISLLTTTPVMSSVFPEFLLVFNLFALTFGNLFFIGLAFIAPMKRRWYHLSLVAITAPAYWLLTSVAAYKALWQIIVQPHYWEKTDHVISKMAIAKREDALRGLK